MRREQHPREGVVAMQHCEQPTLSNCQSASCFHYLGWLSCVTAALIGSDFGPMNEVQAVSTASDTTVIHWWCQVCDITELIYNKKFIQSLLYASSSSSSCFRLTPRASEIQVNNSIIHKCTWKWFFLKFYRKTQDLHYLSTSTFTQSWHCLVNLTCTDAAHLPSSSSSSSSSSTSSGSSSSSPSPGSKSSPSLSSWQQHSKPTLH